jgi:hypothetical protein
MAMNSTMWGSSSTISTVLPEIPAIIAVYCVLDLAFEVSESLFLLQWQAEGEL